MGDKKKLYGHAALLLIGTALLVCSVSYGAFIVNQNSEASSAWEQQAKTTSRKVELLGQMHLQLGYGGFIHNFKNLVLRRDPTLIPKINKNIESLDATFNEYRSLAAQSQDSTTALRDLELTYADYKLHFHILQKAMVNPELTAGQLDEMVKVDDRQALAALQRLTESIIADLRNAETNTPTIINRNLDTLYPSALLAVLLLIYTIYIIKLRAKLTATEVNVFSAKEFEENLFNLLSTPSILVNSDGNIMRANPAAAKLSGFATNTLQGQLIGPLFKEGFIADNFGPGRALFGSNQGIAGEQREARLISADGNEIDVCVNTDFLTLEKRRVALFNLRDLSEEKRLYRNMHERESMLNQAQSVAKIGCWKWDLITDTLSLSDEAKRIYGFSTDIQQFSQASLTQRIPSSQRESVANAINETILLQKPYNITHQIEAEGGATRTVTQSGELTTDSTGKVVAMLGIVEDISLKVKLERERQEREAMLNQAQSVTKAGCWKWDLVSDSLSLSDEAKRIYGFSPELDQFSHATLTQHLMADEREAVANAINESILLKKPFHVRHSIAPPGYTPRVVEQFGELTTNKDGKVVAMLGVVKDITRQAENEFELKVAANVFYHSDGCILVTDVDKHVQRINPGFAKVFGYSEEELLGKRIDHTIYSEKHEREFYREIDMALSDEGTWTGEAWYRRKNGEVFPVRQTLSSVKDRRGNILQTIFILTDVTEQKARENYIHQLAHYDQLTKLPNRTLFHDRLQHTLVRSERNKFTAGLLFIDLDRFKYVNDTLGHDAGDELLVQIAKRLKSVVRNQDSVCRLGGDEFTIILEQLSSLEDSQLVTAKIIEAVNRPVMIKNREVVVGASIGVSVYPQHAQDADSLIKCADTAMYYAKDKGKNQAVMFESSMSLAASDRFHLEHNLRKALEQDQLHLYLQPLVDSEKSRVTGCEALIRWIHPKHGIISPAEFIPLAEETGLIIPIGRWVLEQSLTMIKRLEALGFNDLTMSVNVSSKQIIGGKFGEQVKQLMNYHQVAPLNLELEVTESAVMENPTQAIEELMEVRKLGVTIALDDFGTGYSSLSYLKKLPVSKVKIDRTFVRDMHYDKGDETIVKTIIAMANVLNLRVVAEGVETEKQLNFINRSGCSEIQGFYYSKALPEDEFVRFANDFNAAHSSQETAPIDAPDARH